LFFYFSFNLKKTNIITVKHHRQPGCLRALVCELLIYQQTKEAVKKQMTSTLFQAFRLLQSVCLGVSQGLILHRLP
jgi:hypothetical protein